MSAILIPATDGDLAVGTNEVKARADYVNKSNLKSYGWTEALISKFLVQPDKVTPNPKYRNAAPQQLFLLERVTRAEKTQEFRAELARTDQRRIASKAGVETSRRKTAEKVAQLRIEVQLLEPTALIRRACDSYNWLQISKGAAQNFERATAQSDPNFLERISVNYLRHHCTNYHAGLANVSGRVGAQQAAHKIKGKIIAAIAKKYPHLHAECLRQCPNLAAIGKTFRS